MLKEFLTIVFNNSYEFLVAALIMCSAIIVFLGIMKPLVYNKIKIALLRKSALAFSSVFLCFAVMAVVFLVRNLDFHWYLCSAVSQSVFTIVVYWLYENTCLRNLIKKIGTFTLSKIASIFVGKVQDEKIDLTKELERASVDLVEKAKYELKSETKKLDDELKNL